MPAQALNSPHPALVWVSQAYRWRGTHGQRPVTCCPNLQITCLTLPVEPATTPTWVAGCFGHFPILLPDVVVGGTTGVPRHLPTIPNLIVTGFPFQFFLLLGPRLQCAFWDVRGEYLRWSQGMCPHLCFWWAFG